MRLNEFAKRFPIYADAGVSLELISAPGRGKSTVIRQIIKEMSERDGEEWGYSDLFLATQSPPDLIGFQFKGEVEYDGQTFPITDPTAPTWFITQTGKPVFAYKRGIMFLDEFGQGQTDVKSAAAELLNAKRIGKWRLPDGWIVVAASNRTSDRSGVTKSLDFVINRRQEIHITDDLDSWMDWAAKANLLPITRAFAYANPNIVFSDGVPDKQGPWCTPRSLEFADRTMQAAMKHNGGVVPLDSLMLEDLSGMIGAPAAAQFMATARLDKEMPKYERIVADPEGVKVPERPDAQMLVCYSLAHKCTKADASAVITYVKRMPADFSLTFVKTACTRDATLIGLPAFQQWCLENSTLMAAIGK